MTNVANILCHAVSKPLKRPVSYSEISLFGLGDVLSWFGAHFQIYLAY